MRTRLLEGTLRWTSQGSSLPLEKTSERMDMLATPTGCRNCIKNIHLTLLVLADYQSAAVEEDAARGNPPPQALCRCPCSWLSSHEGIVLALLSCLEYNGRQPARFILGSVYGSPTDTLLALACMSHVWPQPISTISKALFMTF